MKEHHTPGRSLRHTLSWLRAMQANQDEPWLLNARSAALDQNAQHDDKEHAGNYPDNRYAVHVHPPSLCTRSSMPDAITSKLEPA